MVISSFYLETFSVLHFELVVDVGDAGGLAGDELRDSSRLASNVTERIPCPLCLCILDESGDN